MLKSAHAKNTGSPEPENFQDPLVRIFRTTPSDDTGAKMRDFVCQAFSASGTKDLRQPWISAFYTGAMESGARMG